MPKLMIADDDLHLRKLVRTYAELEGYQCEEAENGFEALEKLRDGSYDLMILDIMMPGMDGFETLADFRNRKRPAVNRGQATTKFRFSTPRRLRRPRSSRTL